mmetsp:Transcript_14019/g.24574  ORF Transcript_14019/g.24574 Transcript_14019/m.24574 type:complete len:436 (-) Transcript_14019:220-1527(-)
MTHGFRIVAEGGQGRRGSEKLGHEPSHILGRNGFDHFHVLAPTDSLAVRQELSSNILRGCGLGFQGVADVGDGGAFGALQLDLVGRDGQKLHLVAHDREEVVGVGGIRRALDPHQPGLIEGAVERLAGVAPAVLVEDTRVQATVHALSGAAGAEGAPAAEEVVQDRHDDGAFDVPPATRVLESQEKVRLGIGSRHVHRAAFVLGGGLFSRNVPGGQVRKHGLGKLDESLVLHSCGSEDDVGGCVALGDEGLEEGVIDLGELGEIRDQGLAVRPFVGRAGDVLVHQGHVHLLVVKNGLETELLVLDLLRDKFRIQNGVAKDFESLGGEGLEAVDRVGHLLARGIGHNVGADFLDFSHDLEGVAVLSGFPSEAFQQSGRTRVTLVLIDTSGININTHTAAGTGRIFTDNFNTIFQNCYFSRRGSQRSLVRQLRNNTC